MAPDVKEGRQVESRPQGWGWHDTLEPCCLHHMSATNLLTSPGARRRGRLEVGQGGRTGSSPSPELVPHLWVEGGTWEGREGGFFFPQGPALALGGPDI